MLRVSRLLGVDNTSGFNFVMRRNFYEQVGGYDPNYDKVSPDLELGKRLKSCGKIVFDSNITVRSSYRRYQDGGFFATQWMFFKCWWSIFRDKDSGMSYHDYNQEIR